jgi:hypothetical protein
MRDYPTLHLDTNNSTKATFNNISAILWWSVLLVEETRVPTENH